MKKLNYYKNNNIITKIIIIFEISTWYSKKNNNIDNANYNIFYINTYNC